LAVSFGLLPWVELEGLPRSLPSPLVNAIAIPWAGFVVLPCALAACLLAWVLPEAHGELALSGLLVPANLLEAASHGLAAEIPHAWTGTDRRGGLPWWVGLALIGVGFLALRRGRIAVAAILWLVLGGIGLVPIRETRFARERPRIVFFDVGQADAALVETRDAAWLIDSGPGAEDGSGGGTVLRGLRALGVDRLDGLVITHGDLDHRGGARRLLAALEVGELWLPALARPDPHLTRLAAEARARGVRVVWAGAGARIRSGRSLVLEVLWPPRAAPGPRTTPGREGRGFMDVESVAGRARNEGSIVLRAGIDGHGALFMADVGMRVEQALQARDAPLRAEILKLGHHGSRQSSAPAFLEAVGAPLVLVSAPCGAMRGLPSPVALERVRASGSALAWTGRDGAVAIAWTAEGKRVTRAWGRARDCGGPGESGVVQGP
ncbi:MAG: MBL fold metallo-hydrolase, partial [Thermoleophilia bacterium]|nr:MBL fold metallo-hydrolase [Thermoleophilia bacterium]